MSKAEDPLTNCPLDVVHRIRKSRMQTHLVKCLKNHNLSTSSKLKCPFNPLHIVEAVEIMHHCKSCPDSESVVLEQYETEGERCFSGDIPIEQHRNAYNEMVPQNNEWDEECTGKKTAYDPTANIENRPVLRSLICESKAKRKEFRYQERKRFAALENNEIFGPKSTPEVSVEVYNKPLRQPYSFPKNGTMPAVKSEPAKSVSTDKQTSVHIVKSVPEPTKGGTKRNQSCDENKSKDTDEDSKRIFKILDDVDAESLTDALSQLEVLEKVESAVKERKSKLMNMILSTNATNTSGNSISYRDAAKSKSTVVTSGITDRKLPLNWVKPKCAANFNIADGPSGTGGASSSTKI